MENQSTASVSSNNVTSFHPTTSCTRLSSPYTASPSGVNAQFNLDCKTDYPNSNLVGIFVYTFEDCIEACASYNLRQTLHPNSTCWAVGYRVDFLYREPGGGGICFLKGMKDLGAVENRNASSAVPITD